MNLNTRNKAEQFDFIEIERECKIETLCYYFYSQSYLIEFFEMHAQ